MFLKVPPSVYKIQVSPHFICNLNLKNLMNNPLLETRTISAATWPASLYLCTSYFTQGWTRFYTIGTASLAIGLLFNLLPPFFTVVTLSRLPLKQVTCKIFQTYSFFNLLQLSSYNFIVFSFIVNSGNMCDLVSLVYRVIIHSKSTKITASLWSDPCSRVWASCGMLFKAMTVIIRGGSKK